MAQVVTLEAPVLQIKDAKTGEDVGYGATQTLVRDSRLAILGIGYADGLFVPSRHPTPAPAEKWPGTGPWCPSSAASQWILSPSISPI